MHATKVITPGRIARAVATSLAVTLMACSADSATGVDTFSNPGTCPATPAALPAADVTVTLDAAQRFQTIQGFGSTQRLFDDPHVTEGQRPRHVLRQLVALACHGLLVTLVPTC